MSLDPGNVGYRLNAANLLMEMERPTDSVRVLQNALKLAKSPEEATMIQSRIESVQQYQAARERIQRDHDQSKEQNETSPAREESADKPATANSEEPPVLKTRHGPRRTAKGVLKNVRCSDPAVITMTIESSGKPLPLRARNYYKIEFSAINYTPTGELHPCTDLEGAKALVEYFEAADKSSEGQIVSIQLTK